MQRVLGLGSYETAWSWLHKFRRAMVRPGRDRLTGTVEVDEAFIGGVTPGAQGRDGEDKAMVVIAAEEVGLHIEDWKNWVILTRPHRLRAKAKRRRLNCFQECIGLPLCLNAGCWEPTKGLWGRTTWIII
jgi:hypothetical protein